MIWTSKLVLVNSGENVKRTVKRILHSELVSTHVTDNDNQNQYNRYPIVYSTHSSPLSILVPSLPTMQLDHILCGWRFRCVTLVVADVTMLLKDCKLW